MNKLILPAAILLSSIILGGFYYAAEINEQSSIERQQEVTIKKEKSIEETRPQLQQKVEDQEEIMNEKPVDIYPQNNNDQILINYRLDVQNGDDMRNSLLETAFNSPEQMCPSVIATMATRQHAYYYVLDDIAKLTLKYGQYRGSINYIKNNLDGLDNVISIVKDQCASLGYSF
ncbi:MAG: hypothetical protein WC052_00845 [Patescibacteria group bacterium]|jgi:hypothetical protein